MTPGRPIGPLRSLLALVFAVAALSCGSDPAGPTVPVPWGRYTIPSRVPGGRGGSLVLTHYLDHPDINAVGSVSFLVADTSLFGYCHMNAADTVEVVAGRPVALADPFTHFTVQYLAPDTVALTVEGGIPFRFTR